MAAPDEKEKELLLEFRKSIIDLPLTDLEEHDLYLITWIRARDHDLKKAEEMIRKNFEWRNMHGIDTLLDTYEIPPGYSTRYPFEITGHDDQDCPVVMCRFGDWNVRKALDDGETEPFVWYLGYIARKVQNHAQKLIVAKKKFIPHIIVIVDLKGLSYRQLASFKTVEVYMYALREFEANYPETLKAAYILNMSKVAVIAYNLLRPLVSNRTMSKVEMYDSNASKWKAVLLSKIPADALPVCYGGSKVDSKVFGSDSNKNKDNDGNNDGFTTVTIEAGGQFKLEFNVDQPGTIISWKFKAKKHDIGFSVRHNDRADVVPYARFEARKDVQESSLLCETIGKCNDPLL